MSLGLNNIISIGNRLNASAFRDLWARVVFCFVFVRFLLLIALDKKENNIHFVQKPFPLVISGASDISSREGMLLLSISLSPGVKHCPRLTRR